MTQTVDAIYSNGVLRPVRPLAGLPENATVKVTVESASPRPFDGWVGGVSSEDASLMRRVIDEEFERVEADDWK